MFQIFSPALESKKQRIDLITHLSVMVMTIAIIFWFLNLVIVTYIPPYIFLSIFTICITTLILNKIGYHRIAAMVGLFTADLAIYSIASSETTETGLHMYLGATAFAAFVVFGYEERFLGFAYLIFSVILFFACFFSDFSPLPERKFTETEVNSFFIVNAISFVVICTYLFYLVLRINYKNEDNLRRNEARIRDQNEQLQKTNTELDRFVYSASHDLRAPLSSVSGLITIAESSQNLAEVKDYLSMMKGRVKVLDKFIIDIINYSRNTRLDPVSEKVDLHTLVTETVEGLKFTEGVEQISFRVGIEPNSEIITDPTRLKIILNNLVANAIRYHDKSKSEKFVQVQVEKTQKEVTIHVVDNGQGIHPDHKEKIFNMFYRASPYSNGSGLGLYIAKETIAKLGGDISVSSELGKGSTFSIILPA